VVFPAADRVPWIAVHNPDITRFWIGEENGQPWEEQLAGLEGTALVVFDEHTGDLQAYLDEHTYRAGEVGDAFMSIGIYGIAPGELETVDTQAEWPDVRITDLHSMAQVAPGQVLPLDVTTEIATDRPLKLSARLVAPDGTVVATHDRPLRATDRFGLFVPPAAQAGAYTVAMILYDPETLATVAASDGAPAATVMPVQVAP
jgi:hypothetical protein